MRNFLLKLMVDITREQRYRPAMEWSGEYWVFNLFRIYEQVFGRRFGIRAEAVATHMLVNGKWTTYHTVFTWESAIILAEHTVRKVLVKRKWLRFPYKVYIPTLMTPQGFPVFTSPYLFAIAYDSIGVDASNVGTTSSVSTNSPASGGSNRYGTVFALGNGTPNLTTTTWDGTNVPTVNNTTIPGDRTMKSWCFANQTTGVTTITVNASGVGAILGVQSLAYSGAQQTNTPDAQSTGTASATGSISPTLTTVADNSWLISYTASDVVGNPASASVGTARSIYSGHSGVGDSNGPKTPAGSTSMTWTYSGSQNIAYLAISIAPFTTVTVNSGFFFAVDR